MYRYRAEAAPSLVEWAEAKVAYALRADTNKHSHHVQVDSILRLAELQVMALT